MTSIPKPRVTLTDIEVAERVTAYDIRIFRAKNSVWFIWPKSKRLRESMTQISVGELIEWLDSPWNLYNGQRQFRVVVNEGMPDRLGIAYTDAGKEFDRLNPRV